MIKKLFLFVLAGLTTVPGWCQQPPGTEIFILDLAIEKRTISVSNARNITNRVGYDNQPSFHPTKPLLYYAAADTEGRTDIWEYDLVGVNRRNITNTSEREYSPTVTPDGEYLSCIIQRDNGAQDLGKYPIDGGEASVLINTLTVGYHAWINSSELILFVLGDTMTLHRFHLPLRRDKIVAKGIGRSLHRIPGISAMSFVDKTTTPWSIKRLEADGSVEKITDAIDGREDIAWTPDGKIVMSDGKGLFYFDTKKPNGWQEIALPSTIPMGNITRLTVNANGDKLAIVISE
jgi:hypothetical protein